MVDESYKAGHARYQREWRAKNPELSRSIDQKARKRWRERNQEYEKEVQRNYARTLHREVLQLLGGKCARCGFSDPRALQIDHVNGDGCTDGRTRQNKEFLRRWIRRHPEEARRFYQVLCANCNWIKRDEEGEGQEARRQRGELPLKPGRVRKESDAMMDQRQQRMFE
jgi:hypothetical protein